MHSVQAGMWDPRPPSKHASPLPQPPEPNSRPAHVTAAAPAKRITFYKSGDDQFGGIRMAVHKRSFKCFDALLDDLSQKMPLPFGVRTVTTPRGTHTINHLEQLQDGGCYLCSDRRHTKPVNMELAGKRPNIWYHHSHRPHRPESTSTSPHGHLPYRQRRILLVKNSEPGIRRSVVLSRRSARSMRAFLDEVSEVMQFHVRKLYTAEGRRIDSVQSLMTCPGVLVCVGREAFSPTLVNFIRKSSEEKLPGLGSRSSGLGPRTPGNGARSPATQGARSPPHGAQSRASEYSEGHESKKNVNFGLETKKSIIHPRSDSSNRSARFSLSSDKSYGVGTDPQSRPAIMNEDIEKRVLVNKDGSLSVEMRVRFRLQNDETLQWSTQIQKRPSLTNECCPLSQAQPHYLQQGQSESCSDPDSTSYDPEGVDYSAQHVSEGSHCPCCYQRQEQQYDLWENPIHSHKRAPGPPPHSSSHTIMRHTHSSSSSSSCNSRRVVRCRARLSNCGEDAGPEQSHVVQEEMCMTERVERRVEVEQDGGTHVEVCRVSRCCSRSEVVAMDSGLRPSSGKSADDELVLEEGEDCPLSTVSSSSHVLQSLREDQDDDLPPSASQCSHRNESATTFENQQTSHVGDGSVQEDGGSAGHCGAGTPHSVGKEEEMEAAQGCNSRISRASCRSGKSHIQASGVEGAADEEDEEIKRAVSGMSGHTGLSGGSAQSRTSSVCPQCGGCKSKITSNSSSRASHRSHHSKQASPKPATPVSKQENGSEDDSGSNDSAVSTQSNKTNLTINGCCSGASNVMEGRASSAMSTASNPEATAEEEERAPSAASARSRETSRSHRSGCHGSISVGAGEERSPRALSQKSNGSVTAEDRGSQSREEAEGVAERAPSTLSAKSSALSDKSNVSGKLGKAERPDSVVSARSNKSKVSVKSGNSRRSTCSHCARAVSPGVAEPAVEASQQEEATEERAASALSAKSNQSCKASEKPESPRAETEGEERVTSQMSGRSVKSNLSVHSAKSCKSNNNGSCKSHKSNCNENPEASSEGEENTGNGEEHQERAASALSGKSDSSAKSHKSNCDAAVRGASPAEDEGKSEAGSVKERTPSAMSGKSHTSAQSSKSRKSNCATASLDPNQANGPSAEANGDEKQTQERVASSMSTKSKSSVRSRTSHKSKTSLKVESLSPNVVTIKTPEDEEGDDTTERAQSSASTKSNVSHKSGLDEAADTAVVETTGADDDNRPTSKSSQHSNSQILSPRRVASPQTHPPLASAPTSTPRSPVQQSPGPRAGEARGASALSVHSIKSAKSGRSKCSCGAAAAGKVKQEEEEEDKEGTRVEAASTLSSSSKRRRRESDGTEQPLSRTSSGSVSLGLALDTADSESGKSGISCHVTAEKDKTEAGSTEDVEETGSAMSKKSNKTESKSTVSQNPPAVDIPTIETPEGADDKGKESGEKHAVRAPSANSAKSDRSQRSPCSCKIRAVAETLETGSVKSSSEADARKAHSPDNRTSSAPSSKSAKVRSKSPGSASAKSSNAARTTAEDLANDATEKAEEVLSQSSCCLQPELAASAPPDCLNAGKSSRAKSSSSVGSQKKDKQIKASIPCSLHTSRPGSKVEAHSESTLSHSLSAADLLKETMSAARPQSQQSRASKASQKTKSKKGRGSRNQGHQEDLEGLTPACLPNASPTEVVSDWLRSIPADSSMLALGDEEEGKEQKVEENPGEETAKEEASPQDEAIEAEEGAEVEGEGEKEEAAENMSSGPAPGDPVGNSYPETLLLRDEPLSRNWQSSAAVMKVLLNSSLGRCQSLPEVSPSYGRRLSTSARGFLDCLAQLQLIEPSVNPDQPKDRQYEDIMAILQSLWLAEPGDIGANEAKDSGTEQVTPPRSSSGVGMSSGSGGSGKENGNQGGDETEPTQTNEAESSRGDEGEEGSAEAGPKEAEAGPEETKESEAPPSLDSPKATGNPSSSSANDGSKSPTDNERETLEDSSSGTPPTVLRAPLSKKPSQDPDPVWILHLLKKLEKQFMSHYVDAMAEFKVRWDLDDSIILNTMISELKDEVSRRIQSSIQREMKKIQSRAGRAGKSPQPPKGANLSRDSSTTEKRRRMLRVMKNQSVKTADSLSDGEMTGEFSDQRSDDEYCPCDACVRKKIAARPFKTNPLAAEAPVMMEFDLLKILQLKKSPSPLAAPPPREEEECDSVFVEEEVRNLGVVQEEEEEEEETKEDIQAYVVLEETIPEEDEEKEEDRGEAGATGSEEQEGGATGGEEAEEEETSENGEEEEAEETQCQCQCAKSEAEAEGDREEEEEETSNNTREDETAGEEGESADNEEETGEEEGESDRETVKEATTGEGETTENAENEEEEVVEKEEEEEEEETAGQESAEEEPSRGATEGNASPEAGEGDEGEGGESAKEENGGENEERARQASEEERATPQGVTEGEEADAEDSDTDNKRPSDTSCDESGRDGAEATGDEEREGGDEEVNTGKKVDGALPHQFTKTSVESQPGSLEDIDTDSPPNPVNSIEVPKMGGGGVSGGGGGGQRRSRSPARVKRHKPKGSDAEMDDF